MVLQGREHKPVHEGGGLHRHPDVDQSVGDAPRSVKVARCRCALQQRCAPVGSEGTVQGTLGLGPGVTLGGLQLAPCDLLETGGQPDP